MANRLDKLFLSNSNRFLTTIKLDSFGNNGIIAKRKLHTTEVPVKEIKISTTWGGHIAAKLWGNEDEQPILAVHGWQDNAGTWDPVAPALSKLRPILAIDFPGHGLSSWLPKGAHYYSWDFPRLILYIKHYFKWDKLSLLGHSMGSIAAMRFASVFPDDVEFYIAIDNLIYDDYDLNSVVENYPKIIRNIEIAQTRVDSQPPCYTKEEIYNNWHISTNKSVALASVKYLFKRGTKESPTEPEKYYFSRDPRLKNIMFSPEDKRAVRALVMRLKCPTLFLKGAQSPYAIDDYSVEMHEIIAKNNSNFEYHLLPGTHHFHLHSPELIIPIITNFLAKHEFTTEHSQSSLLRHAAN